MGDLQRHEVRFGYLTIWKTRGLPLPLLRLRPRDGQGFGDGQSPPRSFCLGDRGKRVRPVVVCEQFGVAPPHGNRPQRPFRFATSQMIPKFRLESHRGAWCPLRSRSTRQMCAAMGTKRSRCSRKRSLRPSVSGTYAFRSKAISSRSGTLKTLAGKHCRTLIQVKFPRAYLAVEGSARRFGTAGDLVTPPRINCCPPRRPWNEDRTIPWRRQSWESRQCEGNNQVNRI
jgi:hypothetical protein